MQAIEYAQKLIAWYTEHKRDLPWRHSKNPYQIWLSEVILQQTRVQQGLPYYEKFVEAFPTVQDLANAEEQEVLRLWQGLGYYSRARNMHQAAKTVAFELNGVFPTNYKELIKLKGVGSYTAAAIASFAFGEPVAVVDGNVFRVLARLFNVDTDIASSKGKKEFEALANEWIWKEQPGTYNQAIMEFGALHCTPQNPNCLFCPFRENCEAFRLGKQKQLPVKLKKTKVRKRYFHYLVWEYEGELLLKERQAGDVWQGLYDFHLLEGDKALLDFDELADQLKLPEHLLENWWLDETSQDYKHVLSHQQIFARFHRLKVKEAATFQQIATHYGLQVLNFEKIEAIPKPILIVNYLKEVKF